MYKKIFQYALIAACMGLIGYVYYQFSKGETKTADSYSAVPSNAAIVLEITTSGSGVYKAWLSSLASTPDSDFSTNPISEWPRIVSTLDSLRAVSDSWSRTLSASYPVMVTTAQLNAKSWFLSIGLLEDNAQELADKLMKNWFPTKDSRKFKSSTIYQGDKLQYTIVNNCLVIATDNVIMEDVIIRSEKKDLVIKQNNFTKARESVSSDSPYHFFLAMDNEQWLQLDPVSIQDKISLNGYAVLNSSSESSIRLTGEGAHFSAAEVLPANTEMVDGYSYASFEEGWKKLEKYYDNSESSKFWSRAWKDYGDSCSCDLNERMLSWRAAEWGSAVIPTEPAAGVLYYKVKDSTDVIELMKPMLSATDVSTVHRILYPELFDRNKIQTFLVGCDYITQVRDFVFLSSSKEALNIIQSQSESLSNSPDYAKASQGISPTSGRFIFQRDYYVSPLPASLMSILKSQESMSASFEEFKDNRYFVQITLPGSAVSTATSEKTQETNSSEITSDTQENILKNWEVINHNNKQKETLAFAEGNHLLLFGTDGKLLWKKQLKGEILGDVTQIDALKNNKFQYAFTTSEALYVIDRNGNDLKNFPVKIAAGITSPLHVADYDKNKTYRLIFAASDGKVSNYSIEGNMTKGWKGTQFPAVFITSSKAGNTDYIFMASKDGAIKLLNRLGDTVKDYPNLMSDYDGSKCILSASPKLEDTSVTYTTTNGDVRSVDLKK